MEDKDFRMQLTNYSIAHSFDFEYVKNDKVRAWHGKEVACKDLHGDESLSFDNLRWYADAVMATNLGSYVELECTPYDHRFRRFFVCFGAYSLVLK
ncbi:hypothetical protein QJS04_geneDACA024060 [Acorus gramineus]|uniref:Uncharacterized protein n=1 Tax=Acorus gramineus TaxID=55184 RepID=A0AAV9A3P9_ACOGR|nr:hypothetical protein QJS04_geneDACA024060 [Acorus gramineus]